MSATAPAPTGTNMKLTTLVALLAAIAVPAVAELLEPPNDRDRTRDYFISL